MTLNLENQLETAYKDFPSFFFEGSFVRTFAEVEALYHNSIIQLGASRDVHHALAQAHNQGLKKGAGFFVIKVGKKGDKVTDVLLLAPSFSKWSSFRRTLQEIAKMESE